MARYDVDVEMQMHYSFAIEADNVESAQGEVFQRLDKAKPDSSTIKVHTELTANMGERAE